MSLLRKDRFHESAGSHSTFMTCLIAERNTHSAVVTTMQADFKRSESVGKVVEVPTSFSGEGTQPTFPSMRLVERR